MRACLTGNTVLSLVSGIGCLAFVFWIHTRRRPMKGMDIEKREDRISKELADDDVHTETENREDRISQLSDDVLTMIISRLYTRDAVRTSILSRRWRQVYTFITDVRFHCLLMPETHPRGWRFRGRAKLRQSQMRFLQGVDTFLQQHSGFKIKSFNLSCCFAGCFLDMFQKCMNSVARLGVEQLIIETCDYPHTALLPSISSSPEAFPVSLRDAPLYTPSQNVLKVDFFLISFTSEDVECNLSNCSSLRSLKLSRCVLPSKLQIHGPADLQLKSLVIYDCGNLKAIDLSAVNLISFEIYQPGVVTLSFCYLPLLQNLYIECPVWTVFGEVAADMPNLECMYFLTYRNNLRGQRMAGVKNKLCNLRHFVLMLGQAEVLDGESLSATLALFPLLHKFHLALRNTDHWAPAFLKKREWGICDTTQLKEVEVSGFSGTRLSYDLILHILKTAVSLRRLTIMLRIRYWQEVDRTYPATDFHRMRLERYQEKREWLQGHAISENVDIRFEI